MFFRKKIVTKSMYENEVQAPPSIDTVSHVLAALPDPILILDEKRIVRHTNAAAEDLFGRTLEGRNIVQCFRQPHVVDAVDRVFEKQVTWQGEAEIPAPIKRHLSLTISLVGEGEGVCIVVKDTTLVKRTEEMHSDFVANVSHELRSPLSSIMGFIETMLGPAKHDEQGKERFMEIMQEEANRMAHLIDDLLSLSRVQIQEHVPPQETVDLKEVLLRVIELNSHNAKRRNMSIEAYNLDRAGVVFGDANQITQVLRNLIDNAIKYSKEGTPIEVNCRFLERMPNKNVPAVAIDIKDFGEGIASEHLPRLTERFYRIDKARSRKMGGTGLGLAIVKHILTRHRGRLLIESELGKGSVFSILLPLAPQSKISKPPFAS